MEPVTLIFLLILMFHFIVLMFHIISLGFISNSTKRAQVLLKTVLGILEIVLRLRDCHVFM